jgi:translation initiation factor 5A
MSDSEDHHFESKADAGASKTYPQQAGTIRKNGFIVIKNRPCKVPEPVHRPPPPPPLSLVTTYSLRSKLL